LLTATAAAAGAGLAIWPSAPPEGCPIAASSAFVALGFTGRFVNYGHADTWYPSWGEDDRLYSAFTDGEVGGVGSWSGGAEAKIGHAVIEGNDVLKLNVAEPGTIAASPAPYEGRYPCACLHYQGVWYLGTYGLAHAPYGLNWPILGPFAGFHISKDGGKTWTKSPWSCEPGKTMFPEPEKFKGPLKLGVPHVVDFGKDMENSPDGKMYLVCHGATQWDEVERKANLSWITGDQIYLCRAKPVPQKINDPSQYEYFAGQNAIGMPVWTRDYAKIKPLIDWDHHCGGVTITYDKPLKRYLMCVTDGHTTESRYDTYVLESQRIVGPWRMVTFMKDFGSQAYFVNIPSKFISRDGRTFWICYSANWMNVAQNREVHPFNPPGGSYAMSLHEVRLLDASEAKNLRKMPMPQL